MIPTGVWLIDLTTGRRFQVVDVGEETVSIIEDGMGKARRAVNKLMLTGDLARGDVQEEGRDGAS